MLAAAATKPNSSEDFANQRGVRASKPLLQTKPCYDTMQKHQPNHSVYWQDHKLNLVCIHGNSRPNTRFNTA